MQIRKLRQQLMTKKIGARELAKSYLERIEKNKDLNAYSYISEDVLNEADKAQEKINKGEISLLTGIPISIKDNINVANMPTTHGSNLFIKRNANKDAAAVSNLKQLGAVILGKTNMDELAMGGDGTSSFFGPSLNPHDKLRTPGGSSSGAAVSVAADLCACAVGTDTGGSITQPSSFCGLTGFKPSNNLVNPSGLLMLVPEMDVIGPLAKSAEDCMEMLTCMSGLVFPYPQDGIENLKGVNIAVIEQFLVGDVVKPIEEVLNFFKDRGAIINYVSFQEATEDVYSHYAYSICAKFIEEHFKGYEDLLGKEAIRRLNLGKEFINNGAFKESINKKEILAKKASEILSKNMFVVGPATSSVAPKFGENIPNICTDWINLSHLPNVSTPMKVSSLPLGLSITSYPNMDGRILALANLIEQC